MKFNFTMNLALVFIVVASWSLAQEGNNEFIYDAKGRKDPFSLPWISSKPMDDAEISGKVNELRRTERFITSSSPRWGKIRREISITGLPSDGELTLVYQQSPRRFRVK